MELKGSRTEANLMAAFSGESMARTKYDLYAGAASHEGYVDISNIFRDTAGNELAHANVWFKLLGKLNGTPQNLQDAKDGENYEWTQMYKQFEQEATQEGFTRIAALFHMVGEIEKQHDNRYQMLLNAMNAGETFQKPQRAKWVCLNCGHSHEGLEAPTLCPVCEHPQSFFKEQAAQN